MAPGHNIASRDKNVVINHDQPTVKQDANMRLLALSDIHVNLPVVQKIREREENNFDAVVLAGDIGSAAAQEILAILSSFDCPVLYVYGNWDNQLPYDRTFGPLCHHLHLSPFRLDDVTFVGFSGVPVNWGLNPFALAIEERVNERHRPVLSALDELIQTGRVSEDCIRAEHAARVAELDTQTRDKRRLVYKDKIRLWAQERDKLLTLARRPAQELKEVKEYQSYEQDLAGAYPEILKLNRAALAAIVADLETARTIVVTHERPTRTHEDLQGVPLFLFGHRHGFSDKSHRGSRFVNVSAAENPVLVRPAKGSKAGGDTKRNMNAGSYTIIEASESNVQVRPVFFPVDFVNWVRIDGWAMRAAPYVNL